jgi:hypothetical protein
MATDLKLFGDRGWASMKMPTAVATPGQRQHATPEISARKLVGSAGYIEQDAHCACNILDRLFATASAHLSDGSQEIIDQDFNTPNVITFLAIAEVAVITLCSSRGHT